MNKKEFLNELENALVGRLPESDIREVISDYGDIFDHSVASGKSEEAVSREIGSPARIARTILEDGTVNVGRQYADFQRNINENLAPMPRRLGAYIIDGILLGAVTLGIVIALSAPFMYMVRTSVSEVHYMNTSVGPAAAQLMNTGLRPGIAITNIFVLALLLGAFNLFTTIFIWATNGYTPGKWMLKMRVVKTDGSKIGFLDALLRELVIKCLANSVLSGFLNIGSFIWGCATDDHKTVHDLVAKTRVVEWEQGARHA